MSVFVFAGEVVQKLLIGVIFCRGSGRALGQCCCLCRFPARPVLGPLPICRARSGTLVRRRHGHGADLAYVLEVARAFLARWSIGHVPCDVQARFG